MATILAVTVVYRDLVHVFFWSDDFGHLLEIVDRGFAEFLFRPFAGHVYLLRNVFYGGLYLLFGFDPAPYGWLGFGIQLVNAVLVCRIAERLTENRVLAVFAGALWGACPTHADVVGWFAVQGQALATTASLIALDRVGFARVRVWLSRRNAAFAAVAMWLGVTCSGGGFAMALALPFGLLALVPAKSRESGSGWILAITAPAAVLTFVGAKALYTRIYGPLPLTERMPTLMGLVALDRVAADLWGLLRCGAIALLTRPFRVLEVPILEARIALAAFGVAVGAAFVLGSPSARRRSLVFAGLAAAMYGGIALGRSSISSPGSVPGEPRYHYCGSMFLTLLFVSSLGVLAGRLRLPRAFPVAVFSVWLTGALLLHRRQPWRPNRYEGCRSSVEATLRQLDFLARRRSSQPVELPNEDVGSCLSTAPAARSASLFAIARTREALVERRLRFTTRDETELVWLSDPRHRLSSILAPAAGASLPALGLPSEVPPSEVAIAAHALVQAEVREGRRLGCPPGALESFIESRVLETLLSEPRCPRETGRLAQCFEARESDVFCSSNGTPEHRGDCDDAIQKVMRCSGLLN